MLKNSLMVRLGTASDWVRVERGLIFGKSGSKMLMLIREIWGSELAKSVWLLRILHEDFKGSESRIVRTKILQAD